MTTDKIAKPFHELSKAIKNDSYNLAQIIDVEIMIHHLKANMGEAYTISSYYVCSNNKKEANSNEKSGSNQMD